VLYVCTANQCRSPMAELLLCAALAERDDAPSTPWHVSSAGTMAAPGHSMQPHALTTLAERGIDGDAFRATRLDAASLADVDLVLTATRAHRTATVRLAPRLLRSTFTCSSSHGSPAASAKPSTTGRRSSWP